MHDNDPDDYDHGAFIERSELVLSFVPTRSIEPGYGLTSRLIVDGTMEDVKRQNLVIFYTALLFRIRDCSKRNAQIETGVTISALIRNARATLHIVRGKKRKFDESFRLMMMR